MTNISEPSLHHLNTHMPANGGKRKVYYCIIPGFILLYASLYLLAKHPHTHRRNAERRGSTWEGGEVNTFLDKTFTKDSNRFQAKSVCVRLMVTVSQVSVWECMRPL